MADGKSADCYLVSKLKDEVKKDYVGVVELNKTEHVGQLGWYKDDDATESLTASVSYREYDFGNITSTTYVKKSDIFTDSGDYNKLIWKLEIDKQENYPTSYIVRVLINNSSAISYKAKAQVSDNKLVYSVNILGDNVTQTTIKSNYEILYTAPCYDEYTTKSVKVDISNFQSVLNEDMYMYVGDKIETDFSKWTKVTETNIHDIINLQEGQFIWFAFESYVSDCLPYYESGEDKVDFGYFDILNDKINLQVDFNVNGKYFHTYQFDTYSLKDISIPEDIVIKFFK